MSAMPLVGLAQVERVDVAGRLVVLTGGCGLLGQQWRQSLVRAGAMVYVLDQDTPGHPVDVTDETAVVAELERVRNVYASSLGAGLTGPSRAIDALICAAALDAKPGQPGSLPFEEMAAPEWRKTIDVNLTGVALCCKVFGNAMAEQGHGSIILVSSMYGMVGPDQRRYEGLYEQPFYKPAAYSASKGALLGLAKYLASYWGPRGVRVNVVTFGAMSNPEHDPRFVERMERAIPLGRLARQGEWDGPIHFLVSDASSYMTGANLVVDGGYTAW